MKPGTQQRRAGMEGELETVRKHGPEQARTIGRKRGLATRTLYRAGYFRHILLRRWGRK